MTERIAEKGRGLLAGKVAIITGGGSGIGASIVRAFLAEGASVVIADRDEDAARRVASSATTSGNVEVVVTDVSLAGSVADLVSTVSSNTSEIDVLVNVVGGSTRATLVELSEGEWDATLALNLKSTYLTSRAVLPVMHRRGGRIINVSSNLGYTGAPGRSHYAAAKAGVVGFTKSIALELAPLGITVNAIVPGLTATDRVTAMYSEPDWRLLERQIPLGRAGRPDDIAPLAVLLASEQGAYITGQAIHVNGGAVMP